MNRRGFLTAMLAAGAAPAVCKAENLMKIFVPPEPKILTLQSLGADFDGDVHFSHMRDGLERWRARLERNSVSGAHLPRGLNGRIYHIDEFPYHLDPKRGTDDFDYFKAWTGANVDFDATDRRLITKRNNVAATPNRLNLDVQIRQIKPQAGPLELPPRRGLRGLFGLA